MVSGLECRVYVGIRVESVPLYFEKNENQHYPYPNVMNIPKSPKNVDTQTKHIVLGNTSTSWAFIEKTVVYNGAWLS